MAKFVQDVGNGKKLSLKDFAKLQGLQTEQDALDTANAYPDMFKVVDDQPTGQTPYFLQKPEAGNSHDFSIKYQQTAPPPSRLGELGSAAAAGFKSGTADLIKTAGNASRLVTTSPSFMEGLPVVGEFIKAKNTLMDAASKQISAMADDVQKSAEAEPGYNDNSWGGTIAKGIGGTPPAIAKYATASATGLPLPLALAVTDAIEKADKGLFESAKAAIRGGLTGAGMSMGTGTVNLFLSEVAKRNPALFTKVMQSVAGGLGGSIGTKFGGFVTGEPQAEGSFTKDAVSQMLLSGAMPFIHGKTEKPPAFGDKSIKSVDPELKMGLPVMRDAEGNRQSHKLETGQKAYNVEGNMVVAKPVKGGFEIIDKKTGKSEVIPANGDMDSSVSSFFGGTLEPREGSSMSRALKGAGKRFYEWSLKLHKNYEQERRPELVTRAAETETKIGNPAGTGDALRRFTDATKQLKAASDASTKAGVKIKLDGIIQKLVDSTKETLKASEDDAIVKEYNQIAEKWLGSGEVTPNELEKLKEVLNKTTEKIQAKREISGLTQDEENSNRAQLELLDWTREELNKANGQIDTPEGPKTYRELANQAYMDKKIYDNSLDIEGAKKMSPWTHETGEAVRASLYPSNYRAATLMERSFADPAKLRWIGAKLYGAGKAIEPKSKTATPPKANTPGSTPPPPAAAPNQPPPAPQGPVKGTGGPLLQQPIQGPAQKVKGTQKIDFKGQKAPVVGPEHTVEKANPPEGFPLANKSAKESAASIVARSKEKGQTVTQAPPPDGFNLANKSAKESAAAILARTKEAKTAPAPEQKAEKASPPEGANLANKSAKESAAAIMARTREAEAAKKSKEAPKQEEPKKPEPKKPEPPKTPEPPKAKKNAEKPKTELEKSAVAKGGSVDADVIKDETGQPLMKRGTETPPEKPKTAEAPKAKEATSDQGGIKKIEYYRDSYGDLESNMNAFKANGDTYITERQSDGSHKLFKVDKALGSWDKIGVDTESSTPEEVVSKHVKGTTVESKQAEPTTKEAPKEQKSEKPPIAKTEPPPARKTAAAKPATKPAGEPKQTAAVPESKPAKESKQTSSESDKEPDDLSGLDAYWKENIALLDKVKDTDLHEPFKKAMEVLVDRMGQGKDATRAELSNFMQLKEKAKRHAGKSTAKATGSIRAEKAGSEGSVFDEAGELIGKFDNKGGKVKFYDKAGKEIHSREIMEGQWNEKALSNMAKEVFKKK